jgi:5-methylthioadenosine/S-adenosylhomocysteine deaminase
MTGIDLNGPAFLIRGAGIVSMDSSVGNLPEGDILIVDRAIAAIAPSLSAPENAEVIEGAALIAIPGFVDGHRHLWEGLIRNTLPIETLAGYFDVVNGSFAGTYTPDDVYLGTLISALGLLDCGITSVLDWSHVQTTPEHTEASIAALRVAGVRTIFAYGPPGDQNAAHLWPHGVAQLRKDHFADDGGLITLALATMSPEHVPYEQARAHFELARDAGVSITVHAGIAGLGEKGQIERFGREGLLGPDVNLVHCNALSAIEWQLIAETGTSVTVTPSSEMQMGQGTPPIQACLDYGVKPAIGVDVETSAPGDMWTQLRLLLALQRNDAFALGARGEPQPRLVAPAELFDFATAAGARSIGLGDRTGSLSVGKRADIVLLRADMVNVAPVNDMLSAIMLNMDARNVDTVIVDGKFRKRAGKLLGHDYAGLLGRVYQRRDALFHAAGRPVDSTIYRAGSTSSR